MVRITGLRREAKCRDVKRGKAASVERSVASLSPSLSLKVRRDEIRGMTGVRRIGHPAR